MVNNNYFLRFVVLHVSCGLTLSLTGHGIKNIPKIILHVHGFLTFIFLKFQVHVYFQFVSSLSKHNYDFYIILSIFFP